MVPAKQARRHDPGHTPFPRRFMSKDVAGVLAYKMVEPIPLRIGDHMDDGRFLWAVSRNGLQRVYGSESTPNGKGQRLGTHNADPQAGEASRPDAHRDRLDLRRGQLQPP